MCVCSLVAAVSKAQEEMEAERSAALAAAQAAEKQLGKAKKDLESITHERNALQQVGGHYTGGSVCGAVNLYVTVTV